MHPFTVESVFLCRSLKRTRRVRGSSTWKDDFDYEQAFSSVCDIQSFIPSYVDFLEILKLMYTCSTVALSARSFSRLRFFSEIASAVRSTSSKMFYLKIKTKEFLIVVNHTIHSHIHTRVQLLHNSIIVEKMSVKYKWMCAFLNYERLSISYAAISDSADCSDRHEPRELRWISSWNLEYQKKKIIIIIMRKKFYLTNIFGAFRSNHRTNPFTRMQFITADSRFLFQN